MKSLYLGLNPHRFPRKGILHFPVIKIVPRYLGGKIRYAFSKLDAFSHLIFTSRPAVHIFFEMLFKTKGCFHQKRVIAVGEKTAEEVRKCGASDVIVAEKWTQEGVIEILKKEKNPSFFWPKSSRSRDLLLQFLKDYPHLAVDIYDTVLIKRDPVSLDKIDEIIFTSPSCVDGFLQIYHKIPEEKKLTCIGPITKAYLLKKRKEGPACENSLDSLCSNGQKFEGVTYGGN